MIGPMEKSDPLQKDILSTTKVYSYGDIDVLNPLEGGAIASEAFL